MRISDICITRPVLATVLNIVIVLLGVVAYDRLSLREYPNIDVPTVSVETTWRGASAEIMETQVTKILEDSISGIEGVDFIKSTTREESSQVNVTFRIGRDPDAAAADVRDRVGRARKELPDQIDEPVVAKTEADATPIIYLALSSDVLSPMEITDIADRVVQDRLQILPGVANAEIYGSRRFSMRVWLDAQKLGAYSLTPADIERALTTQNVEIPGGRIEDLTREFTVRTEGDLQTVSQFADIIVKQSAGFPVRLGAVAKIEIAPEDTRVVARHNSLPAVAIGVIKQSTANPLDVSNEVKSAMKTIQDILPSGVNLKVAYDSTVFISASIDAVYRTIIEAIALVGVVIFLFLRSARAAFIPIITIPISLTGALVLMYLMGFSLNTLSLLALVLAIGLVVDDAIVMLENISRYVEQGMKPIQAAIKGSREIAFAVVAMTLTLAAVYAPIAMAGGRTGTLFTEFALTLAGAVVVSGFIALTLTPMLCSRMLKAVPTQQHEAPEPKYVARYRTMLEGTLANPRKVLRRAGISLLLTVVLFIGIGGLLNLAGLSNVTQRMQATVGGLQELHSNLEQGRPIPVPDFVKWLAAMSGRMSGLVSGLSRELAPIEDRGFFIGIGFGPEGSTIETTTKYAMMAEAIYQSIPEREMHFVVNGFPVVTQMLSFIVVKDWAERSRSIQDVVNSVGGAMFMGIPGIMSFPVLPPSLGQDFLNTPVTFILQTTGSWEQLAGTLGQLMGKIATNPGLQNVRPDLELNKPELRISLNRDKVAAVGASVEEVGSAIQTLLGGKKLTRFKKDGEQYDVIVQVADDKRRAPADLTSIYVRGGNGEMVQLANLVDVVETVTPKELNHFNKLRAATITATLAPGYSLGAGLDFLDKAVKEIGAPGVSTDYAGPSREFKESSSTLLFVFGLAIIFIFLVLAAQFESFIDPLVILLSVPLAIFGAMLLLWLTGNSLNIYSQIGLVTLVGLIAKNGILIVEFANQLQEAGKAKLEAVIEASTKRLRPILMTTAATVMGAVPLALASGAGAESRVTIGVVIVGGMTIGTLFTLFVIPTMYLLIGQTKKPHEDVLASV